MSEVHFLAIDPGDVHNGVAYMTARVEPAPILFIHWTRDLSPTSLEDLLESANVSGWAVEEWRLYPELAREQGYSNFPTCERIGVCKYIARRRKLSCHMQKADVKKKARRIGERLNPELGKIRIIGSARNRYRGWDWNAPTQHERDAICHGVWWAFNAKQSPLLDAHLNKESRAVICL